MTEEERETARRRILANAKKDEASGCWRWKGFLRHGRPHILIGDKRVDLRHLSWELWKGERQKGVRIYARCQDQRCVNPDHLQLTFPVDEDRKRFMKKVRIDEATGCWHWTGSVMRSNGYPQFHLNHVVEYGRRASWMLFRGEIPSKTNVVHEKETCGKLCVNPEHLKPLQWGTAIPSYLRTVHRYGKLKREYDALLKPMPCGHLKANALGSLCRVCSEIENLTAFDASKLLSKGAFEGLRSILLNASLLLKMDPPDRAAASIQRIEKNVRRAMAEWEMAQRFRLARNTPKGNSP